MFGTSVFNVWCRKKNSNLSLSLFYNFLVGFLLDQKLRLGWFWAGWQYWNTSDPQIFIVYILHAMQITGEILFIIYCRPWPSNFLILWFQARLPNSKQYNFSVFFVFFIIWFFIKRVLHRYMKKNILFGRIQVVLFFEMNVVC